MYHTLMRIMSPESPHILDFLLSKEKCLTCVSFFFILVQK
jgi:hypothetical protein